ncbi:MAG TPA: tetratricopeptide repeat protein [Nitrospiraceae bacterium]|nr:tetratricopeptide repeat protein [Nitrospiraceae bacterium]
MTVTKFVLVVMVMLAWISGCTSTPKPKVRAPLPLKSSVPQTVTEHNTQGAQAYQSKQFSDAKGHFQQAVAGAPNSAEAHYNLGLTLFALGESEQAREQFIEAANLAPGDKVIWDSPALRQYGSPESNIPKPNKEHAYSNTRPSFGGGPR